MEVGLRLEHGTNWTWAWPSPTRGATISVAPGLQRAPTALRTLVLTVPSGKQLVNAAYSSTYRSVSHAPWIQAAGRRTLIIRREASMRVDLAVNAAHESSVATQLAGLVARLDVLERARDRDRAALDARLDRVMEVLCRIFDREQDDRRRLADLRASAGYAAAYTEPTPLVSVVIPTWSNVEALLSRSLPSVLAQDHSALEVIIVGDAATPAVVEAIGAVGDPRVRFENLPLRGPYPSDPREAWLASGTPPFNAAVRLARGRWISPMSDDDRLEPQAISSLLAFARQRRLEFAYGQLHQILPDGSEGVLGSFPPRSHDIGLQASIYHAGLSFMELELAHALFDVPNDWGLVSRMCLVGVRIGFLEQIVTTYWPSLRFAGPPAHGEQDLELVSEAAALRAQFADLQRRYDEVVGSRRWRWAGPAARALARVRAR